MKLYRHYDAAGRLLYVGIAMNPLARLLTHNARSHWIDEVVNVTIETHSSRQDALKAEAVAIQDEHPIYNRRIPSLSKMRKQRGDPKDSPGMTTNQAIRHFGSQAALADALGIAAQAVSQWGDHPPLMRQQHIQHVTGGALSAGPLPHIEALDEAEREA